MNAPGPLRVSCSRAHGGERCSECKVRLLSVCAALDPDELGQLEALAETVHFAPKATIFMQDQRADHLFNVTSGCVRLYKLLQDGRRQIIGFALPGDFLGLGLGPSEQHMLSADAIDEVAMCRFERTAFNKLVDHKPKLLRRLLELTTHQLSIAQERMVLLGRQTAEQRVISFLVGMRSRWSRIQEPSVTVPLPMGRQDIADFLGLTIETVSRTLTSLARDGLILIVPDGVRLLKPQALEEAAAA